MFEHGRSQAALEWVQCPAGIVDLNPDTLQMWQKGLNKQSVAQLHAPDSGWPLRLKLPLDIEKAQGKEGHSK